MEISICRYHNYWALSFLFADLLDIWKYNFPNDDITETTYIIKQSMKSMCLHIYFDKEISSVVAINKRQGIIAVIFLPSFRSFILLFIYLVERYTRPRGYRKKTSISA